MNVFGDGTGDWPVAGTVGVYMIYCGGNGSAYAGSSVDVASRWRSHLRDLNRGRHANKRLQRVWNKYGADQFVFSVMCVPNESRLIWAEQLFIDANYAEGEKACLNLSPTAGSPRGIVRKSKEDQALRTLGPMDWAWSSDAAIAKRLGVSTGFVKARRPGHIPSPGTSPTYLSAATKAAKDQEFRRKGYHGGKPKLTDDERRQAKKASQERSQQKATMARWAKIKSGPVITCAEPSCGVQWMALRTGRVTPYCCDVCYWRAEARRKAPQRAAYKARRRMDAGRTDYWVKRPMTEQWKRNIAASLRGRKHSAEHRAAIASAMMVAPT